MLWEFDLAVWTINKVATTSIRIHHHHYSLRLQQNVNFEIID